MWVHNVLTLINTASPSPVPTAATSGSTSGRIQTLKFLLIVDFFSLSLLSLEAALALGGNTSNSHVFIPTRKRRCSATPCVRLASSHRCHRSAAVVLRLHECSGTDARGHNLGGFSPGSMGYPPPVPRRPAPHWPRAAAQVVEISLTLKGPSVVPCHQGEVCSRAHHPGSKRG